MCRNWRNLNNHKLSPQFPSFKRVLHEATKDIQGTVKRLGKAWHRNWDGHKTSHKLHAYMSYVHLIFIPSWFFATKLKNTLSAILSSSLQVLGVNTHFQKKHDCQPDHCLDCYKLQNFFTASFPKKKKKKRPFFAASCSRALQVI